MPSTMPLRVGDELLSSARVAAEASGRSAAQQIGYWAKLGRELERSGSISVREVAEVLAGARAYDELEPKEQALVRAEWAEHIDARLATIDLGAELAAEGRGWVELGPDGTVVHHAAPSPRVATAQRRRATPPAQRSAKRPTRSKATGTKATGTKATGSKATTRETGAKRAAKQPPEKRATTRETAAKQAAPARKQPAPRPRKAAASRGR